MPYVKGDNIRFSNNGVNLSLEISCSLSASNGVILAKSKGTGGTISSGETTQILTNTEFTTDITGWTNADHPINGAGGQSWVWDAGNGGQAEASGTPNYSAGLAQSVTITKDNNYSIEISIDESNDPSDKKLFFVDGLGNYQLIFDEVQGITTSTYSFAVVADANYTNIVFTSDIIVPGLNTQTSVQYLRLYETVNIITNTDQLISQNKTWRMTAIANTDFNAAENISQLFNDFYTGLEVSVSMGNGTYTYSGSGIIKTWEFSGERNTVSKFKCSIQGTGPLTFA